MFDRVSEAAEKLAVHVSRRELFGWAGKSALALAGVLAFGGAARAGGECEYPCTRQNSCGGSGVCCKAGCHCNKSCGYCCPSNHLNCCPPP
jgi:hypothetical protein